MLISSLSAKTLVFTVTSGRSGTKLLSILLDECLGINAHHEPAPRVNFVLRSIINAPEAASAWLVTEKLPAILSLARGPIYAETSHLFCKGFIEPMLQLGLRPKFILLTRPAREIASSLYQMNVIPERTSAGRLVLLGPRDPGVLLLSNADSCSDYQLCYWYALEIERRQLHYRQIFAQRGLSSLSMEMKELSNWTSFNTLADFIIGQYREFRPNERHYLRITSQNRNPRHGITGSSQDRKLPADIDYQESLLREAIRP